MNMQRFSHITNYLAFIGISLWLSIFTLGNWIEDWNFTVTIFILPLLGFLTLVLSFYFKKLWTGLISILFILSFPLVFGLGYFFFGL